MILNFEIHFNDVIRTLNMSPKRISRTMYTLKTLFLAFIPSPNQLDRIKKIIPSMKSQTPNPPFSIESI